MMPYSPILSNVSARIPAYRALACAVFTFCCAHRATTLANETTTTHPAKPTAVPALKTVEYQPGVRIDWARRRVEVDATVILREGLLELFACSPRTREHESVVRIEARPLHVYQALGLIGLLPGHPTRFHPQTKLLEPARGEPVRVEVRYSASGFTRTEPIEHWMRLAETRRPLETLDWVFAGSLSAENGAIAADFEGTVVAVVDFDTALIALPQSHTDSNEALWLEPNTPVIPPLGTRCTLVIRAGPVRIRLDAGGRLHVNGRVGTLAGTAAAVLNTAHPPGDRRVEVTLSPQAPPAGERHLRHLLGSLEIPPERLTFRQSAGILPQPHDPQAFVGWLGHRLSRAPALSEAHGYRDARSSTDAETAIPLRWQVAAIQLADDLQTQSLRLWDWTGGITRYVARQFDQVRRAMARQRGPLDPSGRVRNDR